MPKMPIFHGLFAYDNMDSFMFPYVHGKARLYDVIYSFDASLFCGLPRQLNY